VLFGQKVGQILTYPIAQTKSRVETRFDFLQLSGCNIVLTTQLLLLIKKNDGIPF